MGASKTFRSKLEVWPRSDTACRHVANHGPGFRLRTDHIELIIILQPMKMAAWSQVYGARVRPHWSRHIYGIGHLRLSGSGASLRQRSVSRFPASRKSGPLWLTQSRPSSSAMFKARARSRINAIRAGTSRCWKGRDCVNQSGPDFLDAGNLENAPLPQLAPDPR